jgi:hypothetical protein
MDEEHDANTWFDPNDKDIQKSGFDLLLELTMVAFGQSLKG